MLEPEWSLKEHDFKLDLIKTEFYGNEGLLMQVWINLIGNAIKFTPHGGTIYISLFEEDSSLVFKIIDTGVGIDDLIIKNIFDKFYQGDTARIIEGNGLGLALVKRIIDLSGGNIRVKSTIDKGTTFTIVLPLT